MAEAKKSPTPRFKRKTKKASRAERYDRLCRMTTPQLKQVVEACSCRSSVAAGILTKREQVLAEATND